MAHLCKIDIADERLELALTQSDHLLLHRLAHHGAAVLPDGDWLRPDFESAPIGAGSTDVILGAFYHHAVSENFDAFVNGQLQAAVSERLHGAGEDFRPGNTTFVSFGARYDADPTLIPQVQVNISHKAADQGALADNLDSAGTVVYLSPGATWSPAPRVQVFGFVQLPVHDNLVGYQLAPRWTASGGVSVGF